MKITEHLFFNLSILLMILFFALIWCGKKYNFKIHKRYSFLWCTILIWSCIQFSYHPIPSVFLDLRVVPVIIGGLYLGIGPLLSLILVLIRGFYGIDKLFILHVVLYIPLSILLYKVYPLFWKQRPLHRIYISITLGIIDSVLHVLPLQFLNIEIDKFDAYFAYIVVPPLGIAMISITIEFINNNIHMRKKLVKSEKLQAVEQMGAAISHEIRNPLTAAKGFVQLLKESPQTPMKQEEYLSIILQELDSAERVIQDYLTFSKPSMEMVENINIQKELNHVVNILLPTANQHSVEIITNIQMLGSIVGDRQKFYQCFLNVVKNGIESMPRGGQLLIDTEMNGKEVTIIIKDNGIGMSKEQLDRLGEPYYSSKGSKGTGLGMMVVYSVVRAMKGKIRVKSEEGIGTTFQFSFPTTQEL